MSLLRWRARNCGNLNWPVSLVESARPAIQEADRYQIASAASFSPQTATNLTAGREVNKDSACVGVKSSLAFLTGCGSNIPDQPTLGSTNVFPQEPTDWVSTQNRHMSLAMLLPRGGGMQCCGGPPARGSLQYSRECTNANIIASIRSIAKKRQESSLPFICPSLHQSTSSSNHRC